MGQAARLSGQDQVQTGSIVARSGRTGGPPVPRGYAVFLKTKAEFFDPNAMQLHTACSIAFLRPAAGT